MFHVYRCHWHGLFFSDVLLTSITIHLHKQKEFNHFINVKNVFQTRIISTCSLQSNIFYARFQFSMAFHQHIQFISPSPSELCHTFDKPNGVIDYLFSFFSPLFFSSFYLGFIIMNRNYSMRISVYVFVCMRCANKRNRMTSNGKAQQRKQY